VSASVRAASSGNPTAASSDLALLRAAPARAGKAPAQPTARGPGEADPDTGPAAGSTGEAPSGADAAAPAAPAAPASCGDTTGTPGTTQGSRSAFGATLAASMSASTNPRAGAPAARSAKAKASDARSALEQAAAGLLLPGAAPAGAPATAGTTSGGASAAPGDATAPLEAVGGGAGGSAGSDATDAPAAEPAAAAAAAADTATHAGNALALDIAQLPGLKPVAQPGPGNRAALDDELDGPVSDSASAHAASIAPAAAPIATAPAPLTPLLTSSGHGQGGPPDDSQSGSRGDDGALGALGGAGGIAQPAAAASSSAASPVSVPVHAEVGSGGWAQELGVRLNWMAQQGISSASLKLTPEQLGPVEVRISVHQNTASVWFGAAQPDTRSALEQALPKLREMFASQGLNLAHSGVSDQSARSAPREPQSAVARAPAALRELQATPVTSRAPLHQGLIDTYA